MSGERAATAVEPRRVTGAQADATRLFDLELKFNLFPAIYAHISWGERSSYLFPEDEQSLSPASPFWIRRCSDVLLREWELDRQFDFDFSDRGKRLALLDSQALARIAGMAGALLVRDQLRRIIRSADVASLQRAMGVEAYRFALRWERPLPVAELPPELCRLNAPWPERDAWGLRSVMLIFAALPNSAAGVLRRLRFKFPHDWMTISPLHMSEAARLGLSQLLIQIIHDECPEWVWLFDTPAVSGTRQEPVP